MYIAASLGSCNPIELGVLGLTMLQYLSNQRMSFPLAKKGRAASRAWAYFRYQYLGMDLAGLDVGTDANVAIRTAMLLVRLHRVLCSRLASMLKTGALLLGVCGRFERM